MSELKPCPFCGCKYPHITEDDTADHNVYFVECCDCGARSERFSCYDVTWTERTKKQAIEAWNRREGDK